MFVLFVTVLFWGLFVSHWLVVVAQSLVHNLPTTFTWVHLVGRTKQVRDRGLDMRISYSRGGRTRGSVHRVMAEEEGVAGALGKVRGTSRQIPCLQV